MTRTNSRRDHVVALVPAAGITVAQMAQALSVSHKSAEQRLRAYAVAGVIFSVRMQAGDAKKAQAWYFPTAADRDAFVAQHSRPARPAQQAHAPGAWDNLPPLIPDDVEPVELPNSLDERFKVDISTGGFSSLPPGVYALPATSCAARAASEAA